MTICQMSSSIPTELHYGNGCLEFYESTHQLGDTGTPVFNPNPNATVEQLCVPKFDDSGVHVAISFYDTGIIMVQGDKFSSFADDFSHLQERDEAAR